MTVVNVTASVNVIATAVTASLSGATNAASHLCAHALAIETALTDGHRAGMIDTGKLN